MGEDALHTQPRSGRPQPSAAAAARRVQGILSPCRLTKTRRAISRSNRNPQTALARFPNLCHTRVTVATALGRRRMNTHKFAGGEMMQ